MKEKEFHTIHSVTACFSEGDRVLIDCLVSKPLDFDPIDYFSLQSIANFSKRLIYISDQVIASQSNRLPYADFGFLSLLSFTT